MKAIVLVLSDFHAGKMTEHFNLAKCERRIRQIPGLAKTHPGLISDPDEVFVACVGDLVDGTEIYATQWCAQDAEAPTQVLTVREALWDSLLELRQLYPKSKIRATIVRGNHGRWSKTANPVNNLDQWLGLDLADMARKRDDPQLEVQVSKGRFCSVSVAGTRGVLTHKGVPHVGTPANQLRLMGWCDHWRAQWLACGHWHHPTFQEYNDRWLVISGSLVGNDDLNDQMSKYCTPSQVAMVIEDGAVQNFAVLRF